jgi:hypothetical protein
MPDATLALMTAIGHHPHGEWLHRAAETYRRAVGHWFPEQMLLAAEYLFIAAETLSRGLFEMEAAAEGLNPVNVGHAKQRDWLRDIRAQRVFAGDEEAMKNLEAASHGFEHGHMAIQDVRLLAEPVLERSMGLVRRAILDASGVDENSKKILTSHAYDNPRALVPLIEVVTGELARQDSREPAPDMDVGAVELDWPPLQIQAERTATGPVNVTFKTNVTVKRLPPNTTLRITGRTMRLAYAEPAEPPQTPNDDD